MNKFAFKSKYQDFEFLGPVKLSEPQERFIDNKTGLLDSLKEKVHNLEDYVKPEKSKYVMSLLQQNDKIHQNEHRVNNNVLIREFETKSLELIAEITDLKKGLESSASGDPVSSGLAVVFDGTSKVQNLIAMVRDLSLIHI